MTYSQGEAPFESSDPFPYGLFRIGYIYIYIYIHTYVCICMYIYIYIYISGSGEIRKRDLLRWLRGGWLDQVCGHLICSFRKVIPLLVRRLRSKKGNPPGGISIGDLARTPRPTRVGRRLAAKTGAKVFCCAGRPVRCGSARGKMIEAGVYTLSLSLSLSLSSIDR